MHRGLLLHGPAAPTRLHTPVALRYALRTKCLPLARHLATAKRVDAAKLHVLDEVLRVLLVLLLELEAARHKPAQLAVHGRLRYQWLGSPRLERHVRRLRFTQPFNPLPPLLLERLGAHVALKVCVRPDERQALLARPRLIPKRSLLGPPRVHRGLRSPIAVGRTIAALDIHGDKVLLHLLLGPVADVICNVGPVAEPIDLAPVDQQKLLVRAPVGAHDGVCVLLNHPVVVPCLVLAHLGSRAETRAAHIKVVAATRAPDAHRQGDVRAAHVAVIPHTRLGRRWMASVPSPPHSSVKTHWSGPGSAERAAASGGSRSSSPRDKPR